MSITRMKDEQGSVAVAMMIMTMTTALTAALLTTVFRDLKVTRGAGDKANALQVADAGVNEAVKAVKTAAASTAVSCPDFPTLPAFIQTNGIASGTYTYCAAKDTDTFGRTVWHIDATGRDAGGDQRRIRVDARSEPLFPNAINVLAASAFSAGFSVDSYRDELNRCTLKGKVGTNDPANFAFGSFGNPSENCQNVPNGAYKHPPDGCVAYSRDGDVAIPASAIGQGQCPPGNTTRESPEMFAAPAVSPDTYDFPAGGGGMGATLVCANPPPAAGPGETVVSGLVPDKVYFYATTKLLAGCGVDPSLAPAASPVVFPAMTRGVRIHTQSLTINGGTGSGLNPVNQPPNSATICGPSHTGAGDPLYCPGWSGALRIEVIPGGSGVTFSGNHSTFWGVIRAPSSVVSVSGGGGSQYEIFGALMASSVNASAGGGGGTQAKWHYDESLGSLSSGRFFPQNWREEPLR